MKSIKTLAAVLTVLVLAGCSGDRVLWDSKGKFGKDGERKVWDRNGQMEQSGREFWINKDGEKVFK